MRLIFVYSLKNLRGKRREQKFKCAFNNKTLVIVTYGRLRNEDTYGLLKCTLKKLPMILKDIFLKFIKKNFLLPQRVFKFVTKNFAYFFEYYNEKQGFNKSDTEVLEKDFHPILSLLKNNEKDRIFTIIEIIYLVSGRDLILCIFSWMNL